MPYDAVIFDLGGVVFASPFQAFDEYGRRAGLPDGFVRALVRDSSETGAWAALERGELTVDEFRHALEQEAAARGHRIDAAALMGVVGEGLGPRTAMLRAIDAIRARGLRTAALTNNWLHADGGSSIAALDRASLFDVVVESSVVGLRKPDPAIYELVLDRLDASAPRCVYLDDLGINLKPARAIGMTTIKVVDADAALAELEHVLGFPLREETPA